VRATVITQSELEALAAAQSKQAESHDKDESKTRSLLDSTPGSHSLVTLSSSTTSNSATFVGSGEKVVEASNINHSMAWSSQSGQSLMTTAQGVPPPLGLNSVSAPGLMLGPPPSLPNMESNRVAPLTGLVSMADQAIHPSFTHQSIQFSGVPNLNLQTPGSKTLAVTSTQLAPPGVDSVKLPSAPADIAQTTGIQVIRVLK
jgi:hypothetical protein